ncbi:LCP family protein [uncultured Clostridium sp.]|jgi:LCP family protein required for cell wall assembly|uniref:LCP family protein n=1 Tax=uncultured Clostridium sp. TaxID=59620 RepID=UPI002603FA2F|nr:LCP family protein [uncultured Clostridium sp.]
MRLNRTKRAKKKGSVKSKILIGALIAILAVVGGIGGYVWALFGKMDKVDLDKENLGSNVELNDEYSHIKNIAFFGVDQADGEGGRSDSMMVATIDTKNDKIKLTSLMRDSYVEIPGNGSNKLNAAYAFGSEELAIQTINKNFDLNIEDFVTVDFSSLPKVIDEIGGIEINIEANVLNELNRYIGDNNRRLNRNSGNIYNAGLTNLDGVQALAYCRIRYGVGDDFARTDRQREVIDGILKKIFSMSPTKYPGLLNEVFPMVKTSLSTGAIMEMGTDVLSIGNNLEQNRFPTDDDLKGEMINGMSCLTFDKAVTTDKIHKWIFEDIKE